MTEPTTQLLVYRFGPGARFEGQLLGALERMESGGTIRILDAFFVTRDADSGEPAAINRRGDGVGGIVARYPERHLSPALDLAEGDLTR
jgi:hypothetical protein